MQAFFSCKDALRAPLSFLHHKGRRRFYTPAAFACMEDREVGIPV